MNVLDQVKNTYKIVEVYSFEHNDVKILLDINNSDFYSVDQKYIDFINWFQGKEVSENELLEKYTTDDLNKVINDLKEFNILVDEIPVYEKISIDRNREVVNLVMNVSQDCNLRCRYCFASTGHYKGQRELMSQEVADKTLEWFVNQAKEAKHLNLHLFGGEPLVNVPLVKYIVGRVKELEKKYDKKIFMNICTNGTIMNDEILQLIKENEIGLQISIDGPKEIHDHFRPTAEGGSSYDLIVKNLEKIFAEIDKNAIIPRSTISRGVTDVCGIVNHLLNEMKFNSTFFIPAMGCGGISYGLEDVPKLCTEYDKLIEIFLSKLRKGEEFNIFPMISEIDAIGKGIRRIYGCGAGIGFASVDTKGNLYPCMRFTNNKNYNLGNVNEGFNSKRNELFDRTVYNRKDCKTCWARHLCGGACVAIPVENGETTKGNNPVTCEVSKYMVKLAMYASTVIAKEGLKFDRNQLKVTDFMRRRFQ
ncbi:MAG: radical SAM protein [Clostridium sp.]|nr:radical SAM protein [Clostridium sp.]